MKDWKKVKLGEIAEIVGGGTPKTSIEEYWNGNIPWITPRDLSKYTKRFITNGERNISQLGLDHSNAKLLPKGAVLLSSRAPIGYLAISDQELTTNQGFQSLITNKGISNIFLYYLLKCNVEYLISQGEGTTFGELSKQTLKNLEFEIPPLAIQERIAEILSSLDDKIDLLHRQNKTLEDLAQTLFRKCFIQDAKEEWETGKLGDYVETTSGGTPSRSISEYYNNGTIAWVKSKELKGQFIFDTEEKITHVGFSKSSTKLLPPNSILIAMYGATVGEYAILAYEGTCNQAICALLPNRNYPYTFLYEFFRYNKEHIINLAVGSAQQNISQLLIKDLDILLPNQGIIDFDSLVHPFFEKIRANTLQLRTLTRLRDELLPKLMRGECLNQDEQDK